MNERRSVTWIKPNVTCSGSWVASTLGQAEQIISMHYDCAWDIVFDQVVSDDALECSTGVVSWCHNPYIKLLVRPQRTLLFVDVESKTMLREVLRVPLWNGKVIRSIISVMREIRWKVL